MLLRSFSSSLALLVSLVSALGCTEFEMEPTTNKQLPVVYGEDGRAELHEAPSSIQTLATASIVALVPSRAITAELLWDAPAWGEMDDLCDDAPFSEQPSVAACTGVLVAPDLVLTAGHCARNLDCENLSVVFDFSYDGQGNALPFSSDTIYECAEWITYGIPNVQSQADFGWMRLSRETRSPRKPAPLASLAVDLSPGTPVTALGFGGGVPMKWHGGGTIVDSAPIDAADADGVPATNAEWFTTDLDLFSGNSGSPVLNAEGLVLGVVSTGLNDYFYSADEGCNLIRTEESADAFDRAERATFIGTALAALCQAASYTSLCPNALDVDGASPPASASLASGGSCSFSLDSSERDQTGSVVLLAVLGWLAWRGRRDRQLLKDCGLFEVEADHIGRVG